MEVRKRKKGGGRKLFDGRLGKKKAATKILDDFPLGTDTQTIIDRLDISRSAYYRFINSYPPLKVQIEQYRKMPQLKRAREVWNSPLGMLARTRIKPRLFTPGIAVWLREA